MTMMTNATNMMNNNTPSSQHFQSPFLKPKSKSKSKQTLEDEHQPSRVLVDQEEVDVDDVTTSDSSSQQLLGFNSSKDLVWAKSHPHTWWPGYKSREYRGKILVSFFNSDKQLWFHESEMKDFELDFKEMISKKRFETDALDSALEEFGKRLSVELMCCCSDEARVEVNAAKEGFEAADLLKFVRRAGVSAAYDEGEAVGVARDVEYVNAFRRSAFIKRDWIYDETMRVDEYEEVMRVKDGNADYDERMRIEALERSMRVADEDDDSEDILKDTCSEGETKGSMSGQVEDVEVEEGEEEVELHPVEELQEEEEGTLKQIWEKVKKGSAAKKNKEPLEQDFFIEKAEMAQDEEFQPEEASTFVPVEALAFVRRLAKSPGVVDVDSDAVIKVAAQVSRFRRHLYRKQVRLLEDTRRLAGNTFESEDNTKGVSTEDEKIVVQATPLPDDEPLHDILNHLLCLALGPSYSGSEGYGTKCLDATCEKILRYKKMVYQSPTVRRSFYQVGVAEMNIVHEFSEGCSTSHQCDLSVSSPSEENICVVNDVNEESELLSDLWSKHKKRPRVEEKIEDVKAEDVVIDLVRGNDESNYESGKRKRLKNADVNVYDSFHNVDGKYIVDLTDNVPDQEGRLENNEMQNFEDVKVCGRSNVKGGDEFDVSRVGPDCSGVSKSNKRQKIEDLKVCGRGNVMGEDGSDVSRDIPDCNRLCKSNKRQKLLMNEPGSHFQGGSTKTLEEHDSFSVHDDIPGSKLSSDVCKDRLNSKHCTEAGTDGRNVNPTRVGDRSNILHGSLANGTLSEKTISDQHEDSGGGAFGQGPVRGHVSPNNVSGAATDLRTRELSAGKNHGGRSERSANLSQYSNNNSTVKLPEAKILQPLTMLYVSPLSAENPASSSTSQFQLRRADSRSEHPATLHMKFPKDFKLPSKDELVKKFRPFGPIDYLKTKVFFYTGSAQVGFLQLHDAEAACHFAKKKNIFVGGANIRFWLDQREQLRNAPKNVSVPSSLPMTTPPVSELKPCLKVSNPQANKVDRKDLRVKFPSSAQILPSASLKTKNRGFAQSDSRRYSNAVSPDISLEMIELLEKCNQTVSNIKDSLGLQSFYSLFKHNYCHSGFDEG